MSVEKIRNSPSKFRSFFIIQFNMKDCIYDNNIGEYKHNTYYGFDWNRGIVFKYASYSLSLET